MTNPEIDENGNKRWYDYNGNLYHTEYANGDKFWYDEDRMHHREDGPAIEDHYGMKLWYVHGDWIQ